MYMYTHLTRFLITLGCVFILCWFIAEIVSSRTTIKSRNFWGAQLPVSPPTSLRVLPATHVIICHTSTWPCHSETQCKLRLREMQALHVKARGWNDIVYNFLVGDDGNVYEGCGWDVQGSHTLGYNDRSIGIALIGTFEDAQPTETQIKVTKWLLDLAVERNKLSKDYKLVGQSQLIGTISPGRHLYNVIRYWDHWTDINAR